MAQQIVKAPDITKVFEHSSVMNTTIEQMVAFHEAPDVFGKLTPPPIFAQIHRRELVSLRDGEMEFTLWFGPLPIRWLARHEPGQNEHSFMDRQMQGPMAFWLHHHIIEQDGDSVRLTDQITIAHKPGLSGLLTRFMFDGLPLKILFLYRHWRTRMAVER
jgi:ligand-binding SRPBCC domain-containing protein